MDVLREYIFPAVAVGEELLLVVEQLLVIFRGELKVGALHDGVDGAGLLAVAAVDALGHVDVILGRAAAIISPGLGLDGNCLGRANGFAQFACNAPFLASWVASQGVLAAETW